MNTQQKAATLINFVFFSSSIIAVYLIIKYALAYLIPFFVSFAFVYILQKPTIALSLRFKIPKNLLTLIFLLLILLGVGLILYFLLVKLIALFEDLPISGAALETVFSYFCGFVDGVSRHIPEGVRKYADFDTQSVLESISRYLSDFAVGAIESAVRKLPGFLFSVVISIVSACFLAFDYDNIIKFIKRQLSPESVKFVKKLKKIVNYSLFNLFRGYMILMLITFLEMLLGLTVIGVKNVVAISFLIAFVDMLPVFGTGVFLIPWSLYSAISGDIKTGIYLMVLYALCSGVRYFVEPKVIGKRVGMSPLISLFAMFIGLKFFGILGLLLFPLIVSIVIILAKNELIKLWK